MDAMTKIGQLVMERGAIMEQVAKLVGMVNELGERAAYWHQRCVKAEANYSRVRSEVTRQQERTATIQQDSAHYWRENMALRKEISDMIDFKNKYQQLRYDVAILHRGTRAVDSPERCYETCDCYDDAPTLERLIDMHDICEPAC